RSGAIMHAAGLWLLVAFLAAALNSSEAKKYNVLMFIVDDLKMSVGAYGNPYIQTPHIDDILNRGVRFENAHVIKAECAPSRHALFAGRRIDTLRIWDFEPLFRKRNPTLMTYPGTLRRHGYNTVAVGKVYDPRSYTRTQKEDLCSSKKQKHCSWNTMVTVKNMKSNAMPHCQKSRVHVFPGKRKWKSTRQMHFRFPRSAPSYDDCIATTAIKHLNQLAPKEKTPWLLAVGFTLPHLPWVYPTDYGNMYKDISDADLLAEETRGMTEAFFKPIAADGGGASIYSRPKNSEYNGYKKPSSPAENIRNYYRSVSYMDEQVGIIPPRAWRQTSWGTAVPSPVQGDDIFPTILDLCDLKDTKGQMRSGTTLLPLIKNPANHVRSAAVSQYWAYNVKKKKRFMGYSLRTVNHRYTVYFEFERHPKKSSVLQYKRKKRLGGEELYDLGRDGPIERINRADDNSYGEVLREMQDLFASNEDRAFHEPDDEPDQGTFHEPHEEPYCGTVDEPNQGAFHEPHHEPDSVPVDEPDQGTVDKPNDEPDSGTVDEPDDEPDSGTVDEPDLGTVDKPFDKKSDDKPNHGTVDEPDDKPDLGTDDKPDFCTVNEPDD
ncbi:Ulvan-active sulfatase (Arylsulfatase) (Polysaccharide utilization locus H protein P18) (PUL H protein P18) (Sulfatase family S1 subfamily 7 protein P18) (P18_S1_7), partial [Durusdinium trenchii]